ncbi:MAG: hypothetical protein AAF581_07485 [Planctomycetota bacterium]
MLRWLAVSILILAAVLTPSMARAQNFDACGTLLQGFECMIFVDDAGPSYDIEFFAPYVHGDHVRVIGTVNPNCQNFCLMPCITNNVISLCSTAPQFIRGDVNADGVVNIADPIAQLGAVFLGAPLPCQDSLDANDDGTANVADPIFVLAYLFGQGPSMAAPFPSCGDDPTFDVLDCVSYALCP